MENSGCKDLCSSSSSSMFCKACSAGIEMSVSATCKNCWAEASAGLYGLELEFVGTTVESFEVGFYGQANYDIHANMEISAELHKNKTINVFTYSPTIAEFYIGTIEIKIIFKLSVDIPLGIDIQASMQALVETVAKMDIFAKAQYGERVPEEDKGVIVSAQIENKLAPQYEMNAHEKGNLSAGIKLGASISFSNILNLNTFVEGKASLHEEFQSFDGLGREKLIENSTWNYGSCMNSHYLEYYIDLSARAHADVSFLFVQEPLWERNYTVPSLPVILSGCMIPKETNNKTETIFSKLFEVSEVSRDAIPIKDDVVLNIGIAEEICNMMKWPKGSLLATVILSNTTNPNITGISFKLLPISNSTKQYSSKEELEVNLGKSLKYSNATFYSAVVGKYFKGKFSGIDLISSSSFVIPSLFIIVFALLLVTIL